MSKYLLKRLLLLLPTLLAILFINFLVVQFTPGGPVERELARLRSTENSLLNLDITDQVTAELTKKYGFDKPFGERFLIMVKNYATLDFGISFNRDIPVRDLIIEKLPISISLGLWSTILIYLISIPLGIRKAITNGSHFDMLSTIIISFLYAFPTFMLGLGLIMLFGANGIVPLFPSSGFTSYNFDDLSALDKLLDYAKHVTLPVMSIVLSSLASIILLTKNCFLEEISKQYTLTAKAKGATQERILYHHIFRNAMIVIIAGLPGALLGVFLTGSFLTEVIFSLDGIGKLSYESAIDRDYPVVFGLLFIYSIVGLLTNILSDLIFTLVDPRINFDRR